MQPSDFAKFRELIEPLFEYFDKPCTPAVAKIYFAGLMRYELPEISRAIGSLIESATFMPKVVDFLTALEGKVEDRAETAWSLFVEAIRKGGGNKSLYSADAVLISAIKRTFGGWIRACDQLPPSDDPMYASIKKTFLASYRIALTIGATEHYLPGRAEAHNATNGGLALMALDKKETYKQDVICIASGNVNLQQADFSTTTGMLCDATILALPGMAQDEHDPRLLVAAATTKLISDRTM